MTEPPLETLLRAARHLAIPGHARFPLASYILAHKSPGGFLLALLENDLKAAVTLADDLNLQSLHAYVKFLIKHAPPECWGSRNTVSKWVALPDQLVAEDTHATNTADEPPQLSPFDPLTQIVNKGGQ